MKDRTGLDGFLARGHRLLAGPAWKRIAPQSENQVEEGYYSPMVVDLRTSATSGGTTGSHWANVDQLLAAGIGSHPVRTARSIPASVRT